MKDIADKLVKVEEQMAKEKGPFLLFALFLREDAPDLWDVVIAASWASKDKAGALRYVSDKLAASLKRDELLKLSRIVVIEQDNPALVALQRAAHLEHGMMVISDSDFFGLRIKHAYVITSRRDTGSHQPVKPTP